MERGERMRKKRDSVLFIQGLGTGGWMRGYWESRASSHDWERGKKGIKGIMSLVPMDKQGRVVC